MKSEDYAAWAAVRAIGEAVTRTNQNTPAGVKAYLLSDKFAHSKGDHYPSVLGTDKCANPYLLLHLGRWFLRHQLKDFYTNEMNLIHLA